MVPKKFYSTHNLKIYKNVYWAVLGKSIGIISGIVIGVFVARYLGPANYGLLNYIISYVTIFSVFATFGLDSIEIRELAKGNINRETILGTSFYLRLRLSIITMIVILVSLFMFEADSYTFYNILIYASSILLNCFNVIRNYYTSIVKNEFIVKSEISRTLLGMLIKGLFLLGELSLTWFIIASTIDHLLLASGYILFFKNDGNSLKNWSYDSSYGRLLIRESFPLLLSGTAIIIYQKIDQIFIRNLLENNAVGEFAIASKITELIIFLPTVIAQTITPILVISKKKSVLLYNKKKQLFIDIMFYISLIFAIIISFSAHIIIPLLYGEQYINSVSVLQIMAWKAIFVSLFISSGQLIIIENIQKYAVLRNIIGCIISIALNYLLIYKYGIVGAAYATIITISISGYFSMYFIKPYKNIFKLETSTILLGWKRIYNLALK